MFCCLFSPSLFFSFRLVLYVHLRICSSPTVATVTASKMLCFELLFFLVTFVLLPLCEASFPRVLPRAPHHEQRPAFVELHNVIVKARKQPTIHPRLYMPAKPLQKQAQKQESAALAVKRTLLASRQSCDAGYGYCYGQYSSLTRVQLLTFDQSPDCVALILTVTDNAVMTEHALPHPKPVA